MIWRLVAMLRGYRAAYDVEDGRLVVFHNGAPGISGRHFYSWRDAALS